MSEWIPLICTLAGATFVFFTSEYTKSRERQFLRQNDYQNELRKHMDDIIKPLFSLIQHSWRVLAILYEVLSNPSTLQNTKEAYLKEALEKHEELLDFVNDHWIMLSMLLPHPFPGIFTLHNNLLLSRVLSPLMHPEWPEIFDDDLEPLKDLAQAIKNLLKIQRDIRKLIGYETNIELETKYPFE